MENRGGRHADGPRILPATDDEFAKARLPMLEAGTDGIYLVVASRISTPEACARVVRDLPEGSSSR